MLNLRLLLAGVVPLAGLGDALQYIVGARLILSEFPSARLSCFIATHEEERKIVEPEQFMKGVSVLPRLSDLISIRNFVSSSIGGVINPSPTGTALRKNPFKLTGSSSNSKAIISTVLSRISGLHYTNPIALLYIRPAMLRFIEKESFHGGFVGGHTIEYSAFFDYILTYRLARVLSKKFLTTFPISISRIGLKSREKYTELLRRALRDFDVIFLRGKYSFDVALSHLGLYNVSIGLDTGFGVRYLIPKKCGKRAGIVVGVVPRKDYFFYNQETGLHYLPQDVEVDDIKAST